MMAMMRCKDHENSSQMGQILTRIQSPLKRANQNQDSLREEYLRKYHGKTIQNNYSYDQAYQSYQPYQ